MPRTPKADANGQQQKPKPIDEARIGAVRAAIWRNENENGPWYAVTMDRSYQADDGKWHNTTSLRMGDLLNAAKALNTAHTKIQERLSEERSRRAAANGR